MPERNPKKPPKPVQTLISRLSASLESYYVTPTSDDALVRMAALIAYHGEDLYGPLVKLFGDHRRKDKWGKTLDLLCRNPDKLDRVVEAVQSYEHFDGRELTRERFQLDQVVEVMLEIPAGGMEMYVSQTMADGLDRPTAIWHPNTLEYRKGQMKSVFGYEQDRDSDYMDEIDDNVEVVE